MSQENTKIDRYSISRFCINNHGFTVIEIAIVMVIVVLISSVAIPSYMSWLANVHLKAGAREVNSMFQRTRMEAITDNTTLTVRFYMDTVAHKMICQIFKDDGAGTGGLANNGIADGAEAVFREEPVVSKVNFENQDVSVVYNSRGMITRWYEGGTDQGSKTGRITVRNEGGQYKYQVTFVRTGHSRIKVVDNV